MCEEVDECGRQSVDCECACRERDLEKGGDG